VKQRWFFQIVDGAVLMRARVEVDGAIADAQSRIEPGDDSGIKGLTYEALAEAGGGVLEIDDDGSFTITSADDEQD
jgi:hypothetical protein